MNKLLVFAVILLFAAGSAYAKEFEVKEKAGDYRVEFKIEKLRVGANNVKIEVKDKSGKYVTDAKVSVEYSMPEGIDLPPMNFKKDARPEGDKYKTVIKTPMAGTWTVVVDILRGGKSNSAQFAIEVH